MKFLKKIISYFLVLSMVLSANLGVKISNVKADDGTIILENMGQEVSNDIYMGKNLILGVTAIISGYDNGYIKVKSSNSNIHAATTTEYFYCGKKLCMILDSNLTDKQMVDSIITITVSNARSENELNYKVLATRSFNVHAQNTICSLQSTNINMYSDETIKADISALYAKDYYSNNYSKNVDYSELKLSSDNLSVASVDNSGNITAQGEGHANITVSYNGKFKGYIGNGVSKTEDVLRYGLVNPVYIDNSNVTTSFSVDIVNKIKGISFKDAKVSVKVGETYQQNPLLEVNKEGATTSYEWESSNTRIATVDENGVVTVKNEGETIITAKTTDKSKSVATYVVKGYDTSEVIDNPNTEVVSNSGENNKTNTVVGPDGTKYIKAQAPDGVRAVAGKNSIKVTWNAVNGASAYVIYRASEKSDYKQIGITAVNNFTDKGAVYNKKYIYKIVTTPLTGTIGNSDMSEESNLVNFKIKIPKIKSVKKNKSKYTIKISGTTYAGYLIYVGKNKKPKKVTASVNKKTVDLFLKKNKTYYIRIKAYAKVNNSNMYSKFSKVKKIKTR